MKDDITFKVDKSRKNIKRYAVLYGIKVRLFESKKSIRERIMAAIYAN